jgi:hypothetical protein
MLMFQIKQESNEQNEITKAAWPTAVCAGLAASERLPCAHWMALNVVVATHSVCAAATSLSTSSSVLYQWTEDRMLACTRKQMTVTRTG